LAAEEKINSFYVSRVLRLTLLASDIMEAALDGRQSAEMKLPALMGPLPTSWPAQRALLNSGQSAMIGRRKSP
jgi:hypothetical protein